MYLIESLWRQWTTTFKDVTPNLHCASGVAKLHSTNIFFKMYLRQSKIIRGMEPADGTHLGVRTRNDLQKKKEKRKL